MPYTGFHWESAQHAWERRPAKPPFPFALAAPQARCMLLESAPVLGAGMPAQPLAACCHRPSIAKDHRRLQPKFLTKPRNEISSRDT